MSKLKLKPGDVVWVVESSTRIRRATVIKPRNGERMYGFDYLFQFDDSTNPELYSDDATNVYKSPARAWNSLIRNADARVRKARYAWEDARAFRYRLQCAKKDALEAERRRVHEHQA